MSSVTVNVNSRTNISEFPYTGSWETGGAGFVDGTTIVFDDLVSTGFIDSQDVQGETLIVAGTTTQWSWYSDPNPGQPAIMIAMADPTIAQDYFTSVTITPASGGSGAQTLNSADATFNPRLGSSGSRDPYLTVWAWSVTTATDFFANGVVSSVEFDGLPVPPPSNLVPAVLGLLIADAVTAIITAGFIEGTVTNVDGFPLGIISAQDPSPGASADLGSAVTLSLNAGPMPLGAKFVSPMVSKAIMLANPGTINPRVYPPQVDTTAIVLPQRLPI